MKDTHIGIASEAAEPRHSETYLRAVRALDADKRRKQQNGYAVMLTAAAMVGTTDGSSAPGRVARAAQKFCILFAFAAPNILFAMYVL
ncbi:hypothetical protein [Aestuariivita sp.]|jgi:hypothetical protein|uniref:hypothetical protein n=1 Tax=Aestuariivita sp. TaxID=1872407 RepID=UPI00216DD93D|nr:hypothetical protein [Aestuariivita sp.]MCE8008840.1 hypothetical protein [Aestuariivita sp.]